MRRIVTDLSEKKVTVSDVKNKAQQAEYIEKFDRSSSPDLKKLGIVKPVDRITGTDFKAKSSAPTPKKRAAPDVSTRRTLVPKPFRASIKDNRVASVFRELRSLKVGDAPNAIAVLFRVFLELSVDHYMDVNKLPLRFTDVKSGKSQEKNLSTKVADCVQAMVQAGAVKKDFSGMTRSLSVAASPLSIDLLHAYVHNRFTVPKSHDLLAAWDEAQPFIERLWQ